eukprot:TRINITY_DN12932_c0_g1_i1.p1 TRINITY_DN12932_c0_g1~~TRINITY_DN12932_c0_g1_i1.p1  ORF type:complete len:448 (+),score=161.32 TRINITY_DN12932_c0_g1_i1:98-1441(+)
MSVMSAEIERGYIERVNELLRVISVPKQIESLKDCSASMFILLLERLLDTRIKSVIRTPRVKDDHMWNAQRVIDALEDVLELELSHIQAENLYRRETGAIVDLIDIFSELQTILSVHKGVVDGRQASTSGGRAKGGRKGEVSGVESSGGEIPASPRDRRVPLTSSSSTSPVTSARDLEERGSRQDPIAHHDARGTWIAADSRMSGSGEDDKSETTTTETFDSEKEEDGSEESEESEEETQSEGESLDYEHERSAMAYGSNGSPQKLFINIPPKKTPDQKHRVLDAMERERKIARIRDVKFYDEETRKTRAIQMERRSREETALKRVWDRVLWMMKDDLHVERGQRRAQKREIQRERRIAREAEETHFRSQLEMVRDLVKEEREAQRMAEKGQKEAIDRMVRELQGMRVQELQKIRDRARSREEKRYYTTFDEDKIMDAVVRKLRKIH